MELSRPRSPGEREAEHGGNTGVRTDCRVSCDPEPVLLSEGLGILTLLRGMDGRGDANYNVTFVRMTPIGGVRSVTALQCIGSNKDPLRSPGCRNAVTLLVLGELWTAADVA